MSDKITLELDQKEVAALVKVIDDANKAKGLENADFCSYIYKKIQAEVKKSAEQSVKI